MSAGRTNLQLLDLRRIRLTASRVWLLATGVVGALRLWLALARGFAELRFPTLRSGRIRSFEIGRATQRRRIYLRGNGMDTFTFYEVFIKGVYDRLLPLREDDVILDMGANIGMASSYFEFCCPGVRVIAAEPEQSNASLWRRNLPSPEATLLEVAIAARCGDAILSVRQPTSHHLSEEPHEEGPRVRTVTPDELARRAVGRSVTLIKCDIEGAECEVFTHPWDVLEKVRMVLIEVHGEALLEPIAKNLRRHGLLRLEKGHPELPETFARI
jgi:FkbM family methyltransferase